MGRRFCLRRFGIRIQTLRSNLVMGAQRCNCVVKLVSEFRVSLSRRVPPEIQTFSSPIWLPPFIFEFNFLPFFGLYSQSETTSVTRKASTKFLGGVSFLVLVLKNLHGALTVFHTFLLQVFSLRKDKYCLHFFLFHFPFL